MPGTVKTPEWISKAYTVDSEWRNRNIFLKGREEIIAFLKSKWEKELNNKLRKEYWEFDENGYMAKRFASINYLAIEEKDRKFR
jgi:nuclear transport factor 2 (NTF2) superfamily protein